MIVKSIGRHAWLVSIKNATLFMIGEIKLWLPEYPFNVHISPSFSLSRSFFRTPLEETFGDFVVLHSISRDHVCVVGKIFSSLRPSAEDKDKTDGRQLLLGFPPASLCSLSNRPRVREHLWTSKDVRRPSTEMYIEMHDVYRALWWKKYAFPQSYLKVLKKKLNASWTVRDEPSGAQFSFWAASTHSLEEKEKRDI